MPLASLCLLGTLSHLSDGALMDRRTAEVASGPGNRWFLAAGLSLPLLEGRPREARETIEGFVLTAAATQLLKHWTRSRRPDGSDHLSFPSGHTSAAFSLAASPQAPFQAGWNRRAWQDERKALQASPRSSACQPATSAKPTGARTGTLAGGGSGLTTGQAGQIGHAGAAGAGGQVVTEVVVTGAVVPGN